MKRQDGPIKAPTTARPIDSLENSTHQDKRKSAGRWRAVAQPHIGNLVEQFMHILQRVQLLLLRQMRLFRAQEDQLRQLRSRLEDVERDKSALERQSADRQAQIESLTKDNRQWEDASTQLQAALDRSCDRLKAMSGNVRIYDASLATHEAEVRDLEQRCGEMRAELEKASSKFIPSKFWIEFCNINMMQLRDAGLSNFKLTVNQNYHNFIPLSVKDPKVRQLLKWAKGHLSARELFARIEDPDHLTDKGIFGHETAQIFKDNPNAMVVYRVFVTLIWKFASAHDRLGLCRQLAEPELGNPIRVWWRRRLISQDLATATLEMNALLDGFDPRTKDGRFTALEIGAGYGRVAYPMLKTQPIRKYVIIDIPPTLYVSEWYLSRLFPEKKIFRFRPFDSWTSVADEFEAADIAFFLPHQLAQLPDGLADIALTIASLEEMLPEQANYYLEEMGRLAKSRVFSKQYYFAKNPYDNIVFSHDQYKCPTGFTQTSFRPDLAYHDFFVTTYDRV